MYRVNLSKEEKKRVANGDVTLLLSKLEECDEKITKDLKTPNSNTAFLQGASCIVDKLIEILATR